MGENQNISDLIFEYIDRWYETKNFYVLIGIFSDVNETELIANFTPGSGETIIPVNLGFQSQDNSYVIIPNENSIGFVFFINDVDAYILAANDVNEFRINGDLIKYNGGFLGGLIIISDLVSKLNTQVGEINIELGKIATAITGLGGTYVPSPISTFNKSDFEDNKILH